MTQIEDGEIVDPEIVRSRTAIFGAIIEDYIAKRIVIAEVTPKLRAAGATDDEIAVFLEQVKDFQEDDGSQAGGEESDDAEQTREAFRQAELAAQRATEKLRSEQGDHIDSQRVEAFLSSILRPASTLSLSPGLLALAPRLGSLCASSSDKYLEKTWKLRQAFAKEPNTDLLIDTMQQQPLRDPIPRSIWKDILQDKFISFPKLFATMEPGYDHRDDAKEFHGGFSLVQKDQISARKPLRSETDWIRVFDAWSAAVSLLFDHRNDELTNYREFMVSFFRDVPDDPNTAIRLDNDVREQYAKNPFRLDDQGRLQRLVMSSVIRNRPSPSSSLGKRPSSSAPSGTPPPRKKMAAICLNWNAGLCDDPCPYGRRHGSCSQCGEKHRAKDQPDCSSEFHQNRARKVGGRGQGIGGAQRA
jgi:hypothetical protein